MGRRHARVVRALAAARRTTSTSSRTCAAPSRSTTSAGRSATARRPGEPPTPARPEAPPPEPAAEPEPEPVGQGDSGDARGRRPGSLTSRCSSAPRGEADEHLRRFRRLLTATILATFALIVIGGVVRVSDSGLGCGAEGSGTQGWPLCGGRLLPFLQEHQVIEFSHRVAATVIVVLIGALAFMAFRRLRDRRWLVRGVVAAGILVLAQAILGGLTVEHGLHTAFVAAHLGLAMLLLGLLITLRRLAQDASKRRRWTRSRALRCDHGRAPSCCCSLTIIAGGYVAGTEEEGTPGQPVIGAHLACGTEFPTCLGKFMPFSYGRLVDIQLTHRLLMYLTAIAVLAMTAVAVRRRVAMPPDGNRAFLLIPLLLVCQILLGAINVWVGKHAGLDRLATSRSATILWAHRGLCRRHPRDSARAGRSAASGGLRQRGTRPRPRPPDDDGERDQHHRPRGAPAVDGATAEGAGLPLTGAVRRRGARDVLRDYLALTKPRIISLLLITTVATMFVADPSGPASPTILWTILGGYLAAGGAGAINHYMDRDRDARMARTCDRPLVAGRIEPLHGLMFGIGLGIALGARVQLASPSTRSRPLLALSRAARLRVRLHALAEAAHAAEHRHRRRRRRGAAARRLGRGDRRADPRRPLPVRDRLPVDPAPLLGPGAADQGRLRRAPGCPMLPVARGDAATRRQILVYSIALVAFTVLPVSDRPLRLALPRRGARAWAPASSAWRRSRSRARRAPRRSASTWPRSPTWRCSSRPWRWIASCWASAAPRRGAAV